MAQKPVSQQVIKRLPKYLRHLDILLKGGSVRVSSMELAKHMNITSSQVRQDLNHFGCFGQQGYGYTTQQLYNEVSKILGLTKSYSLIVIGAGNLGRAITQYQNFTNLGFNVIALFDHNNNLCGTTVGNTKIQHTDAMEAFISENKIDIAVLTIKTDSVQGMADKLVSLGIKSIWNFVPFDISVPNDVIVEDVRLADSLMMLSYALYNDRDTYAEKTNTTSETKKEDI